MSATLKELTCSWLHLCLHTTHYSHLYLPHLPVTVTQQAVDGSKTEPEFRKLYNKEAVENFVNDFTESVNLDQLHEPLLDDITLLTCGVV